MKEPNGSGTVYKLPGKRRKPWIARITEGWELQENKKGEIVPRQKYRVIGYFKTRQEGREALALNRINPVSPMQNITLGELYEEWSSEKYKKISKDTVNNYKAAWIQLRKLEKAKVKDIKQVHLQKVIDSCSLGHSSLKKIRTLAKMLFDHALQNDIVAKNYASYIALPKNTKQEKDRFSDLEIKKIENAAKKDEWAASVLILIFTGLRISEMLLLTKFNISKDKETITGGIKTDAGKNRAIPIHPKIKPHILHWLNKNGEAVICDPNLKKLSAKQYREKYYYPALQKAKVRQLTPHACRHTFASMLAESGVDTVVIKQLMGHTKYSYTADEYTNLKLEALKDSVNKL